MLKKLLFLVSISVFLASCTTRQVMTSNRGTYSEAKNYVLSPKVQQLLTTAESYMGTPYKFGGTTKSGMDCSGLVSVVFESQKISLPRVTRDQATAGKKISLREAVPGDLLFFATSGGSRITHVGIVHDIESDGSINFIHASTSRGVIVSPFNLKYWQDSFITARRVL